MNPCPTTDVFFFFFFYFFSFSSPPPPSSSSPFSSSSTFLLFSQFSCQLTLYHTCHILTNLRCIAAENIERKGEIARNKQFILFSQCFLSYMVLIFHFKCTLKCCQQFVSIWTSLKFCRLFMS